jgi:hypothetical protein
MWFWRSDAVNMDFRNPSAGVQGEIELQQTRKYTWSGQTQLTAASVEMPTGDRKVTNGTKKSLNLPCSPGRLLSNRALSQKPSFLYSFPPATPGIPNK